MKHLYIILLVLPLIGFGQGWEQDFGQLYSGFITPNFYFQSTIETNDGGYIVIGDRSLIIKTDEDGDSLWTQQYYINMNGCSYSISIQQTTDGGYVILGINSQCLTMDGNGDLVLNGDDSIYLMKINENGDSLWTQTFMENVPPYYFYNWRKNSVKQTIDGGYIICVSISIDDDKGFQGNDDTSNLSLIKTDQNGEEQWTQIFGGEVSHVGRSVQQTSDGGYIITGYIMDDDLVYGYMLKTDENGNEVWYQVYDWRLDSVQQTTDGGYIVGGECLMKTDENGNTEYYFLIPGYSIYSGEQLTLDGGYVYGSYFLYDDMNEHKHLVKLDQYGEEEWFRNFDQNNSDDWFGTSINQTNDGGYLITGYRTIWNSDGFRYSVLIKTDSQGNITSTIELPTPTSKRELIKTTNILGQENTTIKNQPLIEIYDDGSTEKKIVIE